MMQRTEHLSTVPGTQGHWTQVTVGYLGEEAVGRSDTLSAEMQAVISEASGARAGDARCPGD